MLYLCPVLSSAILLLIYSLAIISDNKEHSKITYFIVLFVIVILISILLAFTYSLLFVAYSADKLIGN